MRVAAGSSLRGAERVARMGSNTSASVRATASLSSAAMPVQVAENVVGWNLLGRFGDARRAELRRRHVGHQPLTASRLFWLTWSLTEFSRRSTQSPAPDSPALSTSEDDQESLYVESPDPESSDRELL